MSKQKTKKGQNVDKAVDLLMAGELVGIPTETVYGLAANALDTKAVASIFTAKNRPTFDPLIIHLRSVEMAKQYVLPIPPKLEILAAAFMPGPLTLLLKKKPIISDLLTAGLPRVALRVPNHPLVQQLLEQIDFPLAAPSANPFGYISPTSAQHVLDQLKEKVAYVLDGGQCQVGLESTIVGMEGGKVVIYRKGGLSIEKIAALIGEITVKKHSDSNPSAPGMLKSHYAPRKSLRLLNTEHFKACIVKEKTAYLGFQTPKPMAKNALLLSKNGDLETAAQNLFAYLRLLDEADVDEIIAELLPEIGLGRAINDRLRRAAA